MHNEPDKQRRLENQQQKRATVRSRTDSPLLDNNGRDQRVGSSRASENRHHTGSVATSRGHSSRKREPDTRLRQSAGQMDIPDSTRGSELCSREAASKGFRHSAGYSQPTRDEHRGSQERHSSRHRARLSSRESSGVRTEERLPPPPPLPSPLPPPPPPTELPPPPPLPIRDPALDFFSADFSALKALDTIGLLPPNPNVAPLDTVDRCRFILPPEMEESLAGTPLRRQSKEAKDDARSRSGPLRVRQREQRFKGSVIARIAEGIDAGPLLLLRRCFDAGARVRVVTRHARGVRGAATGTLRAFDKHMNLVLQDVEEEYTVRLKQERTSFVRRSRVIETPSLADGALPVEEGETGEMIEYQTIERSTTVFKQEKRSRKLKQIFVRGSNVVMIAAVSPVAQPQQSPGAMTTNLR